jgi:guanylate kinase
MHEELLQKQELPLLVVISGPSGVGKDSALRCMKDRGLPIEFVVTATTRPQRAGEQHGVDYFFVSREEFAEMIENDDLIEYAIVYGDYKGIPKSQVEEALSSGRDVVMRVDVQGAQTIRKLYPEALLIFLSTRTEDELVRRLEQRKTESREDLKLRIATARKEMRKIDLFDYYVLNAENKLEEAVDTIIAIIHAEHHRVNPRQVNL